MASAQDQIMTALQSALIAGGTVAASRVFIDRVDALQPAELPAILIDDGGFSAETVDLDGTQERTANLVVACALNPDTTTAAEARAFGVAVEVILASSATVQDLVDLDIAESRTNINGDGDRYLASCDQTWRATYTVNPAHPDIIIL